MNLFIVPKNALLSQEFLGQKLGTNFLNVDVESWLNFNATGGPRLVRILGPGKNRTMRNSY